MNSFECLSSPIEYGLLKIAQSAKERLFIAVPYISKYGIDVIIRNTNANNIWLLTNLDIENVTSNAFDIKALLRLWDKFQLRVSSLGKLHAKVYIADTKKALITSANLTLGGLRENYEYGVVLQNEPIVRTIFEDMQSYFGLGNIFERYAFESLIGDINEIQILRQKYEASAESKRQYKEILKKQGEVKEKILLNRVREGKTINSIFSDTILYLLKSRGPLSTQELHPLIQNIHTDICDDTIDRVINGQHFGKRWKHMVRNAQQYLKNRGEIYQLESKWKLKK